ncbi:MAG: NAD-dependent succinate-semialdehyde dehydrogenase [Candidatus Bathyarchaeia archaeon]|jgi:succinate-semialdehyde dehydrogenase/glutarate-semialdehyde dehydrogenase
MGSFFTINPATSERIREYKTIGEGEARAFAKEANLAFERWRETEISQRSELLLNLAKVLRDNKTEYARAMTVEMGKPIKQSLSEVEKCAWSAEVIAKNGGEWLRDEPGETDAYRSIVAFEPLGTILGVMPWNFPFWQALRFAMPAVLAGNTTMLRHSNVVPQCALLIEEAFTKAGFPDNVFKTVVTEHSVVDSLIGSEYIRGVSFTGSTDAGRHIAVLAAQNLKKCVLELGGSDPLIVLEDARLDKAASIAAESRLVNSGQSCINAKRFIVVKGVYDEFKEMLVTSVKKLVVGDPQDEKTDVGPLVREDSLKLVESQVKDAIKRGGRVLIGGRRLARQGYFYEPTIIDNVGRDARIVKEEVFGPVAPIIMARTEEEAIRFANETVFGLAGSLWTEDLERASRAAKKIESGVVFVNGLVKSDPRMPFGGVKQSGLGRELSKYGIREFVNTKGINVYRTT